MPRHTGRDGRQRKEFDIEIKSSVAEIVDSKPHATYIKYLMTKRCGPLFIINELHKLGLSAPSRTNLVEYYNTQVDPLVRKNKLVSIYSSYKNRLNGRKVKGEKLNYISQILNFKSEIGEASSITQANFCKFLKDLGVEHPWMWELTRFYKTADNFPVDSNGVRILTVSMGKQSLEKVVSSRNRYIIERLIIENLSDTRIAEYCKTQLHEQIYPSDIALYKEVYFNTKLNGINENLKLLESEKVSQESLLNDVTRGAKPYCDMSAGERTAMIRQINQRINEIDENLRVLRAAHTNLSYDARIVDLDNFQAMFSDVVKRSYRKFCSYDGSNDRDIATPMAKIAGVMSAAYDKLEKINAIQTKDSTDDDGGIKHGIAELMQSRLDEIEDEEKRRANEALAASGLPTLDDEVNLNDVGGVDELGMDFSEDKAEE